MKEELASIMDSLNAGTGTAALMSGDVKGSD